MRIHTRVYFNNNGIAAPIGVGLMEFGKFLFWPFGNAMISKKELSVEQYTKSYQIY